MGKKALAILIALLVFAILTVFFLEFRNAPDKEAYEDILNTMSLNKAKRFFARYPQSKYKHLLIAELIAWCRREDTEECYRMMLDVIPNNDKRAGSRFSYYDKSFILKGKEGFKEFK